ncbi:MAG: hypothetical protein QOE54_1592 [Streptosporangiaceae bacterium]|jgi:hypothetical protein|nr:hypothetical protein [Streptosporangiaceae bacterium]MDX6429226.1 hypothetical protein [Streptosporangiaceae bacterium]
MTYTEGEWELSPEDMATIFAFKGWLYATPSLGFGVPSPERIETIYRELAEEIAKDGREDVIASRGRFMAVKLGHNPGSIDMYLNIGFMWGAITEEEREMLEEMGYYDEEGGIGNG